MKIALFASGSGSNAEALIKKAQELSAHVQVAFVLSDKKDAFVLERAERAGVPTYVVEKTSSRTQHEEDILQLIDQHQVDWIFLAGYMRLISAQFLQDLRERHGGVAQVINIHPSLLPAYPGIDSIARAHKEGVTESGVSIHYVDEGMDTGPLLAQEKVALAPGESLESFASRIHAVEHAMYTQILVHIVLGKIPTRTYKRNS